MFGKEKQTGEDRGFFCLLVSRLLFSVFALYSNRQRRSIYRKENSLVRWGKTLDCVSRCAFCSLLVSIVCLSLSLRVCTSRESESVCCSWYSSRFNLGFRVSLILSLSVLFLFVNVWSLKDREREN